MVRVPRRIPGAIANLHHLPVELGIFPLQSYGTRWGCRSCTASNLDRRSARDRPVPPPQCGVCGVVASVRCAVRRHRPRSDDLCQLVNPFRHLKPPSLPGFGFPRGQKPIHDRLRPGHSRQRVKRRVDIGHQRLDDGVRRVGRRSRGEHQGVRRRTEGSQADGAGLFNGREVGRLGICGRSLRQGVGKSQHQVVHRLALQQKRLHGGTKRRRRVPDHGRCHACSPLLPAVRPGFGDGLGDGGKRMPRMVSTAKVFVNRSSAPSSAVSAV